VDLAPNLGDEGQVRLSPAMAFTPTRSPRAPAYGSCRLSSPCGNMARRAREPTARTLSSVLSLACSRRRWGKQEVGSEAEEGGHDPMGHRAPLREITGDGSVRCGERSRRFDQTRQQLMSMDSN
jgi:hypothetical protein